MSTKTEGFERIHPYDAYPPYSCTTCGSLVNEEHLSLHRTHCQARDEHVKAAVTKALRALNTELARRRQVDAQS